MKLVCFNAERLGAINAEGRIVDLTALAQPLPGHTLQQVVEKVMLGWAEFKPAFEHALATQKGLEPDSVALMPPVVVASVHVALLAALKLSKPALSVVSPRTNGVAGFTRLSAPSTCNWS